NLGKPLLRLSNEDEGGESHAALTSGTEGCTNNGIESGVLVGIGHNAENCQSDIISFQREYSLPGMILCSQVGLYTLAIGRTSRVDVFTSGIASNKRNSLDA